MPETIRSEVIGERHEPKEACWGCVMRLSLAACGVATRATPQAANLLGSLHARLGDYLGDLNRAPPWRLLSSAASMKANISMVSSALTGGLPVLKNLTISITSGS